MNVVAGIDVDPMCRFPYAANNEAHFLELDVRKLSGERLRELWAKSRYSLLAGCAPCQPFSTYGRRKDKKSTSKIRWGLLRHFGRLIQEAIPDFVTMENVPQLVRHKVFDEFVNSLHDYSVWWGIIDCARYGVPQTRKRLVLMASRLGPISLVDPSSKTKELSEQGATVRGAISHLKSLRAGETDPGDALHSACKLSDLNLRRIRASSPGGTWREWDSNLVAKCHLKASGETYPSVYGRMQWDVPAPTITTQSFGYGNGRFGHPEQDRAITLRESAILQTFPDSYKFLDDGEKPRFSVMGRLIGNAVPVRIGEAVAQSLMKHLTDR